MRGLVLLMESYQLLWLTLIESAFNPFPQLSCDVKGEESTWHKRNLSKSPKTGS